MEMKSSPAFHVRTLRDRNQDNIGVVKYLCPGLVFPFSTPKEDQEQWENSAREFLLVIEVLVEMGVIPEKLYLYFIYEVARKCGDFDGPFSWDSKQENQIKAKYGLALDDDIPDSWNEGGGPPEFREYWEEVNHKAIETFRGRLIDFGGEKVAEMYGPSDPDHPFNIAELEEVGDEYYPNPRKGGGHERRLHDDLMAVSDTAHA